MRNSKKILGADLGKHTRKVRENILDESHKKWMKYLRDTFEGRTIKCTTVDHTILPHVWKKDHIITIKSVIETKGVGEFAVITDDYYQYNVHYPTEPIKLIK